jgi:1-acylglycerone phosphate reductase
VSDLSNLPDVTVLTLDVSKPGDINVAVNVVTGQIGGTLNYLDNNAGRNHFMPILDEDSQAIRDIIEINLIGPITVTQASLPSPPFLLIKAKGMAVYATSTADTSMSYIWVFVTHLLIRF